VSSKREALVGRFRARALDRLRQTNLSLVELEEGRGDAALLKEVARELHTLKGDARVMGFEAVSELAHAAEDRLLGDAAGALPTPAACAQVRAALDLVARVLRDELVGDEATQVMAHLQAQLARSSPEPAVAARVVERPAEAPPSPVQEPSRRPAPSGERWMHVKASRVDELCERVSDFSVDFRTLMFQLEKAGRQGAGPEALRSLMEEADRCRAKLEDTVASAWSLRMVPVEPALEELVGHARELAQSQGKRVRVTVRSEGAEVERGVLDSLQEPLMHLVRNAVDHGLERPDERGAKGEEGLLTLRATPQGPSLVLEVSDDGRGVDVNAVRAAAVTKGLYDAKAAAALDERSALELLFRHGFSTRSQVSQVSGRGVGLDIVRERLDALGGSAHVTTALGRGATFKLTVPSTLTRERALVVECGGVLYGLPSAQVLEVVRLSDQRQDVVAGGVAMGFHDEALPLRSLVQALGARDDEAPTWAAVLEVGGRRVALALPKLLGEQDLLRRPLDALLGGFEHLSASATLDDGRLVLLLSVAGLLRRDRPGASSRPAAGAAASTRPRVLVVDDSLTIVDLVRELLVEAGFEVKTAHDGQAALEVLHAWLPELVLADVDMPVMDGFELLRQVRMRWQHLPVVMLTTRGSADDRRLAASLGASAYLVKSQFEEATLLETVRRYLKAAG
jgi:chemotaxis protein histidine kinase CheA/CheY-like chemotaxis protein